MDEFITTEDVTNLGMGWKKLLAISAGGALVLGYASLKLVDLITELKWKREQKLNQAENKGWHEGWHDGWEGAKSVYPGTLYTTKDEG